jgi:hypothetical protein
VRSLLLICCVAVAFGQPGTTPKAKADDYESHGRSQDVAIGAEYMIHSFSGQGETYIANDYLVVEVALYPPKDGKVDVKGNQFTLRINGKKQLLAPETAQMVAAKMQRPEWQMRPRLEAEGGLGNTGVILGRPVPSQTPGGQRSPNPIPRSPVPDNPNVNSEPRVAAHELAIQSALPEGEYRGPVSGFLYFPYKGRTSAIKSLELIYKEAALQLR